MLIPEAVVLLGAGFIIGIFAIIMGGTMFFSVPLMQALFPEIAFGAVVGNLKVGSLMSFTGSIISTHKKINYTENLKVAAFAFPGAVLGASIISHLDQRWIFPVIIVAIALSVLAPKIAHLVTRKTFHLASFLTGIYAGFFGAGVGLIFFALLRLKYTEDHQIALTKIQVRFVEWMMVIAAVATHYLHGNLIAAIWLPWASGALVGGFIGGLLLEKMGRMPGHLQKYVLYAAFSLALIVAGVKFLEGFQ